ncbi:MAG: dTMP kinase [Planctomycetota bacterium]
MAAEQRGRFFVLDGIDGCGKTTQAQRLCDALRSRGGDPLHLREPGSTAVGERIRAILLDPDLVLSAPVEALLFAAARRAMLTDLVAPALVQGRDVVCERFHPSTFAYQAVAGGLDENEVLDLLHTWAGTPRPDLVVLLDLDVDEAARRRGEATDRIEAKGVDFLRVVAEGYRRSASLLGRIVTVEAGGGEDEVHAAVLAEVERAR